MNMQKKKGWILLLSILALLIFVVLFAKTCFNKPASEETNIPKRIIESTDSTDNPRGSVEAQMKNVDFHIDEGIILQIKRLRGMMI
jgi:hypothetical protein